MPHSYDLAFNRSSTSTHDFKMSCKEPLSLVRLLSLLSLFLKTNLSHAVVITQCCIQALYEQGEEGQAAVDMAKEFERRKCNHFKKRPEDECMIAMAGKHSPHPPQRV